MSEGIASLLILAKRLSNPPPCFERKGSLFWSDPWTSRKALEIQLDPDQAEGARSRKIARAQAEEVIELVGKTPSHILDLGCGPGFHLTRFATLGCRVDGIDVSPAAVEYAEAQQKAETQEVAGRISISEGDMLSLPWERGTYDLVLLLFGEFCLLTPEERATFLEKARDALAPGGILLLELFYQPTEEVVEEHSWEYREAGFWSSQPYLELTATNSYPEAEAVLHRFFLLQEGREPREERIWESSMEEERLTLEARGAGLRLEQVVWDHPLFDGGGEDQGRRWFLALLALESS